MIEAIFAQLSRTNFVYLVMLIPVAIILVHLVPWAVDPHGVRSYPGPWLAKFSDLWLVWTAAKGRRSDTVRDLHLKYGPIVRLAPNHISISEPAALEVIYAHGNRTTKTDFYDSFTASDPGVFNVLDRAAHSRKRKIVSHVFAPKTVLEFEPHVKEHVTTLIRQWDRICEEGAKGKEGGEGGGWVGHSGRAWFDCLPWFGYLAFDIIGDLAFGSSFGMLVAAKDSTPIVRSHKMDMQIHGQEKKGATVEDVEYISAIEILRQRSSYNAIIGLFPSYWRPVAKHIPWISRGGKAIKTLTNLAVTAVSKRLATPSYRTDFLTKLLEAKDAAGMPLGPEELTAEAFTLLVAGSSTTTNALTAVAYYLAANLRCQKALQKELDEALVNEDNLAYPHASVKSLRYLEAVINESLRLQSVVGSGLPRLVPEGGMLVLDRLFPAGTVLSMSSYCIHLDASVWGGDVAEFRPERWLEGNQAITKAFYPFSFGPRACVGKNLVMAEMPIIVASLFRRYELVLENPDVQPVIVEGFARELESCKIGIKRRSV
ncbi:cytochrome P450 [Amylostereum chailletii]|nr:cytochrome P450 [Amylostereum chailletii]